VYRVKTFNRIAPSGLSLFPTELFSVGPELRNPHALLLRSHPLSVDSLHSGLLAIARAGAGINNIPVDECTKRGIVVFNTPGANANSVKELVVAAMLLSSRDVLGGVKFVNEIPKNLQGPAFKQYIEDGKKKYVGRELKGRVLGIVGLGAIGATVANIALAMGMQVLGYDPYLQPTTSPRVPLQVKKLDCLRALFAQSDIISLHLPATKDNHGLIDRTLLSECERGTVLLNFARSEVVNHNDVLEALQTGLLAKYFNDFPMHEYTGHSSIYSTPHLGASTVEAEENSAAMAVNQLINFFNHGDTVNSVNFPNVQLERTRGFRVSLTTLQATDCLSIVLSTLGVAELGVEGLNSSRRDAVAYHLIDLDREPSGKQLDKLRAIERVIDVRPIGFA